MIVNDKKKFIYIHSPKTGGTTIRMLFDPNDEWAIKQKKHAKIKNSNIDKRKLKEYTKFSFVRNPWERQVSLYEFSNNLKRQNSKPIIKDLKTFLRLSKEMPAQIKWLTIRGVCIMDFVGRIENFEEDVMRIAKLLDIQIDEIPKCNATYRNRPYQEYYDSETLKMVERIVKPDVDAFGYKF